MKTKSILLLIGGVIQVLILALHVAMFFGVERRAIPAGVSPGTWAYLKSSLHIFNATVTAAVLCFACVSLFKRVELLSTGLGRMLCAFMGVFYLQRVVVGAIVRGFDPGFGTFLLALSALYAFAAMPSRADHPAVSATPVPG